MSVDVENISINVKTNAGDAAKQFQSLSDAMRGVSDASKSVSGNDGAFSGIDGAVKRARKNAEPLSAELQEAIKNADKVAIYANKAVTAEGKMYKAFKGGNESAAWREREKYLNADAAMQRELGKQADDVAHPLSAEQQALISTADAAQLLTLKLENLKEAQREAFQSGDYNKALSIQGQILSTQSQIERTASSATKAVAETGKAAKTSTSFMGKLFNSIKRIAMYRLLRTVMREITQAFAEGLKNAYNFSKGISGTLAAALDSISTKSLTMKNQLGAAFGGLLTAIAPILLRIIELVRAAAQALSALFSALGGGQYLIATDVAQSWDKATGAAKKYKNTILGFDEINRLDEPSGGGGGSAVDASKMFEVGELPGWAKKLKEFIDNEITPAIEAIKFNIKDVLFNWDNLTPEDIARKVVTGLITFLGAATGFSLAGVPGALVGTLAGIVISGLINRATFNGDGKLGEDEVMKMIGDALFVITGGIIGFMAGGVGGALIGASIGAGIALLIDSISFSNNTKMTGFGYKLADAITAFTGAIIGFAFGGVPGAILGAAIGLGISLLIQKLTFGDKAKMFSFMPYLAKAISAFVGGVVGFVVSGGNPLGAVLGAAIGVNFDMIIQKILPKEGVLDRDFVKKLAGAMTIVTGIVFGALIGGVPGAIIGATIGIALTLAINDVSFSDMKGKVSAAVAGINERLNLQVGKSSFSGAFASGGAIENTGSLFLAGEAGPEIVANMGSKTGVMNVDQMEAAVANGNSAVVGAVYAMANAIVSAIESKDTDISIDGESLARRLYKPLRDVSNQRGASLVMA